MLQEGGESKGVDAESNIKLDFACSRNAGMFNEQSKKTSIGQEKEKNWAATKTCQPGKRKTGLFHQLIR